MPIFTTSWTLTMFAHDLENFESVQRIYDVAVAGHPLLMIYIIVATIMVYRDELEEHSEEYQSSVCFFVFKAPLKKLESLDTVEQIISMALELEQKWPVSTVLEAASKEKGIQVTKRKETPFR